MSYTWRLMQRVDRAAGFVRSRTRNRTYTRRRFLQISGGAIVTGAVTTTVGLGKRARAQVRSTQTVFRLSTRNTRTCNGCRQHARHKVFDTFVLADANRAHPGCNCPINSQSMESSLLEQLRASPTRRVGVWDRRALFPASAQSTRQLVAGWNLIGIPGDARLDDVTTALAGRFAAIFAWDAGRQQFLAYHARFPDQATLRGLRDDQALWILVTDPEGAQLPLPEEDSASRPRSVPLLLGWNLVPWSGEDGISALEATVDLGDALDVLHTWDAAAQRFIPYAPRFQQLNVAPVQLRTDEGAWLLVNRAIEWSQTIA